MFFDAPSFAPSGLGGAGGGASQMSGWGFSGWDPLGTYFTRRMAKEDAEDAFNRSMYASNTAWQRGLADMQAAGVNPMLAVHQGGASSPQSPMASSYQQHAGANTSLVTAAQVSNLNADTQRKNAEADEIRARTPTHGVQIERMRQEISESVERIRQIQQNVLVGVSTAAHMDQQVRNLQEQIPQINASTQQLRTLSELNEAQAIETITRAGLNEAHAREILQRLKRDLPALEEAQRKLEIVAAQMAQPGHAANEAAQSSLAGTIGAYLRALLPLQGIMGAIPVTRSRTIVQPPPRVIINQPGARR